MVMMMMMMMSSQLRISPQPERWSSLDLAIWLKWAAREFSLHSEAVNVFIQNFKVVRGVINYVSC